MKKPKKIKDENDFRRYIHAVAEEAGWHVDHIESPLTSPGIVDLMLSRNGIVLWFECKVWRDGIHMLPSQKKWHRDMREAGNSTDTLCYSDGIMYWHEGVGPTYWSPTSHEWRNPMKALLLGPATVKEALEIAYEQMKAITFGPPLQSTDYSEKSNGHGPCDPRKMT